MDNQHLIEKFCPLYYFDTNEKYHPIDLNKYIEKKIDLLCVNSYVRKYNDLYYIYYISYYTYDAGKTIFEIDSHEHDFEIIILEIKNDLINRACFCPHGSKEHFWLNESETKSIVSNNKIKVYVSKGKHAQYPIHGTIWRYYGFANDTNNNRHKITYLRPILLTDTTINSQIFKDKKGWLTKNINNDIPTVPISKIKKRLLFVKI